MKIVIMRGIPGSGKSTYAKQLFKDAGKTNTVTAYTSADSYFMNNGVYQFDPKKLGEAHKFCMQYFLRYVNNGFDLILVDNTNINLEDIAPYVAVGEAMGYDVEIVQVNAWPDVAAKRNVHGVPEKKVLEMHQRLNRIRLPSRWKVTQIN